MTRAASDRQLLAIYLDDHRAAAAAGQALARRVEHRYRREPGFEALETIRREVESDVRSLDELRAGLDVHGGRWKQVLAVAGEKLGRLKLNGRLIRRSPLSRLVELELLSAGITAKRRLWDALISTGGSEQLAGIDLRRLRDRADGQLEQVHRMHQLAAKAIPVNAS